MPPGRGSQPRARLGLAALASAACLLALPAPAAQAAPCATGAQPNPYHANATLVDDPPIVSADGTTVPATLHLPFGTSAVAKAPAVLMTHGGGGDRVSVHNNGEFEPLFDALLDAGFAVLMWDSRGHGESNVPYRIGHPQGELADVEALVDYLAACDEILREAPGDPLVGWAGISNGGGIQLLGAANDWLLHQPTPRIDAIAPSQFWGETDEDFFTRGVPTEVFHWLYREGYGYVNDCTATPTGPDTTVVAQEIHDSFCESKTNGALTPALTAWWHGYSTTLAAPGVHVPTLLVQGTPDTGAPLGNALDVYELLDQPGGPPVGLYVSCHAHGGCPYGPRDMAWVDRTVRWMNRYVLGLSVSVGPAVEWQAQDMTNRVATDYPLPGTAPITFTNTVPVALRPSNRIEWPPPTGLGASGGDKSWANSSQVFPSGGPVASGSAELTNPTASPPVIGSALRARALDQPPADRCIPILGRPEMRLKGAVLGSDATIFLELQDAPVSGGTPKTLDQVVIPFKLPGGGPGTETPFDVTIPLHAVAWVLQPGHRLNLEVSTASAYYWDPTSRPAYAVRIDELIATYPAAPQLVWALNRCT